ncbi:C4-dicarboxylate ABC transporter substrate-binding protein [Acuticoccus sediminis]|uniref:C4-dicarboxylate ABC transporter substrate-binding protein n=1 Tax=Acuticoccus sediminis TaxID=2184697 RepID=A0A8B2NQB4_9HYPH|nr:TRAP transporter substrate-binding protein DctP [Acuticoccus sediminis]RAI00862.1 C4-dicarboxylate ABC transporter substrate-binding protein [Acuticoccus sediminis]
MRHALTIAAALALSTTLAHAQDFTLRLQTFHSADSPVGEGAAAFIDDVETMSDGRIKIEPFFSSAVVKSVETFDAAVNGILDVDMTAGSYQVGKDSAFQFVGDPMGGYDDPWQLYAFVYNGGGLEAARELYASYGMYLVGFHIQAPESLASSKPLRTVADLKNFKFRSPPGMETMIFANLGATPVVMDFTEVFTALESGVIDGADAANLAVNKSLGLYDVVKHATYPGFHSTPANHLAVRKDMWDSMPADLQRIFEVAYEKFAFRLTLASAVETRRAASELAAQGVEMHDWSMEDRKLFRDAALSAWDEFADTERAKQIVKLHKDFQSLIGLREAD